MISYTSTNRPLVLNTPLGPDALLVAGFEGHEGISELFHFRLDLRLRKRTSLRFEMLLGQKATLTYHLPGGADRHFGGILNSIVQNDQDEEFTWCEADLVPRFWLWTQRQQSRIFQQQSVPDILRRVLHGLDVDVKLTAKYEPREFCVQYRESDFAFASRLMEDEGIYYFFEHGSDGDKLLIRDHSSMLVSLPNSRPMIYDRVGKPTEPRVRTWSKAQTIRPSQFVLWDHHFEVQDQLVESRAAAPPKVSVGAVEHTLVGPNADLEIFEGFAGVATRFDVIDRDGGERKQEIEKIHDSAKRAAALRMEEETVRGLEIRGRGDYGQFTPGYLFQLERHFDAEGKYLLTRVEHLAKQGGLRSGEEATFSYENQFRSLPEALPYRPIRNTPRPVIAGTQTALVVGPSDSDTYLDKFGRVKVQFHWDRHGKKDAGSSCWLRVAQVWAGKRWGAFFWPRKGHEVVVAFEEGDPDRPIIVGSVYNAANMPPFELPANQLAAGIKSCSVGLAADPLTNFNGVLFFDSIGNEHVEIHSERANTTQSESGQTVRVGKDFFQIVGGFPVEPGSGSGGGLDSIAKAGPQPTLAKALETGWANHHEFTFGSRGFHTLGLAAENVVGGATNILVNPLAFAAAFAATNPVGGILAGALGGFTGETNLCVGTGTNIHYGPALEIQRGVTLRGGGDKPSPLAIAAGLIIGGLSMAAQVSAAAKWEKAHDQLGPLADVPRSAAMAVLVGIETALAWGQAALHKARRAKEELDLAKKRTEEITQIAGDLGSKAAQEIVTNALGKEIPELIASGSETLKKSAEDAARIISRDLLAEEKRSMDQDHFHQGAYTFFARELDVEAVTFKHKARSAGIASDSVEVNIEKQGIVHGGKLLLTSNFMKNIVGLTDTQFEADIMKGANTTQLLLNGSDVKLGLRVLKTQAFTDSLVISSGKCTLTNRCGYSIEIDEKTGIILSAGQSKISLTPEGVKIEGLTSFTKAKVKTEVKTVVKKEESNIDEINDEILFNPGS